MKAILLGAGFSRWAANLPTADKLFDMQIQVRHRSESRKLELLRKTFDSWYQKEPQQQAEQFVVWCHKKSGVIWKRLVWYVTRRLSEPFFDGRAIGRQTYMIDDSKSSFLPGVVNARRYLNSIPQQRLSGILTTNYDLLIEHALTTKRFHYGRSGERLLGRGKNLFFPWQGAHPELTGRLPLAKLHGSLSWDREYRYTDGRAGIMGNALIVPPLPEKKPPSELVDVWRLAEQILSQSESLTVFGFAFNKYDVAILNLLRRCGKQLRRVEVIDVDATKGSLAKSIWPLAEVITRRPPYCLDV